MKKFFLTLTLIGASITMFAQDFNVYVGNMNGYTRQYKNNEVVDLYYNYYGVPQVTLNSYYNDFDNNWGNVALGLELSRILGIPMPDIFGIYREGRSNGQGWGVMAKRYGIKPGSAAFHRMKDVLGKSQRTWGGVFGDYGKNKNPKIARKDIYIFDNGMVKMKNGKKADKQLEKMIKQSNKRNKNNNGNNGNRGKGNRK